MSYTEMLTLRNDLTGPYMKIVDNKVNFAKFMMHRGVQKTPFYALLDGSTGRDVEDLYDIAMTLIADKGFKDLVIKPAHMADSEGLVLISNSRLQRIHLPNVDISSMDGNTARRLRFYGKGRARTDSAVCSAT